MVTDPSSQALQWLATMRGLALAPQNEQQPHIEAGLNSPDADTRLAAQAYLAGLQDKVSQLDKMTPIGDLTHVRRFSDGECPHCHRKGRLQACVNCAAMSCGSELIGT